MKSPKLIAVGVLVAVSISGFAQAPVGNRLTFDVASIKPSAPGIRESMSNQPSRLLVNRPMWIHELQAQEARLSTRGRQMVVPDSSHMIPYERPDAIISAIHEVWSAVRANN